MKRARISLASLLVVVPVMVFAVLLWINWGPLETRGEGLERLIRFRLGGGRSLLATLPELLAGTFITGAVVGLLAGLIAFAGRRAELRARIEELAADRRKLAAANRALEAALPVLRERYDAAIGGLDPQANALNEPIGEAADEVSLHELVRQEAAERLGNRRGKAAP